jgi:co-chaperonin GroES (HSP10)
MYYQPLGNKVLIERLPAQKQTQSGIILQSSNEPDRAKVLATGPQVDEVAVNDVVLVDWNKTTKFDTEKFIISIENIVFIYG